MAWLKAGDTAAMDERVLGVAELADADERSVNEVFGFVMRLFLQSAQQAGDYRVTMGTAIALGPTRYEALLAQAERTGLLTVTVKDERRVIRLVADGEFLHMRSREEITWENQRKADTSNDDLTVLVRRRDGDACRYCGKVVNWADRKGNRGGTYDHLIAGRPAETHHDLVVACKGCNSGRGTGKGRAEAKFPLLPPPAKGRQYFSKRTIGWLEENGTILTAAGLDVPKRPRGAKDKKPGTSTRTDVAPTPGSTTGDPSAAHAATAPSGDQRAAHAQTRPDDAATAPSGDQRSGTARATHPADGGHQRAVRASEAPADAAPHTSGHQRAGRTSKARTADAGPSQVAPEVEQIPGPASENATSRSDLEVEGTGSGFPGSGRDGSGRAGKGREGPGAAGAPQGRVAGKTKRGRRKRRRR